MAAETRVASSAARSLGGLAGLAGAVSAAAMLVGAQTHPLVPLAVLGAIALAACPPMLVLHLAIAVVPLAPVASQLTGASVSPSELLATLAGLSWGVRRVVRGEALYAPSPLTAPLVLLLITTAAGLVVAHDPATAVKRAVFGVALFWIIQMLAFEGSARTVRSLLSVVVASAAVVGVIAVGGSAGAQPEVVGDGLAENRATGTFEEPNLAASYLGFGLPAAIAMTFAAAPLARPALLACSGAILAGIALSLSRGGLFAAGGSMIALMAWGRVRRAVLVTAVLVLALSLLTTAPLPGSRYFELVSDRVESIGYAGPATGDYRWAYWTTTPQLIVDHLPLGVGAGGFRDVSPNYGLIDPNQGDALEHPHSVVLTVAAETGLPGIVGLLLLVVRLPAVLVASTRRLRGRERGLAFGVAGGLTAFAFQALIDYTLWAPVIAVMVATFLGMALALRRS